MSGLFFPISLFIWHVYTIQVDSKGVAGNEDLTHGTIFCFVSYVYLDYLAPCQNDTNCLHILKHLSIFYLNGIYILNGIPNMSVIVAHWYQLKVLWYLLTCKLYYMDWSKDNNQEHWHQSLLSAGISSLAKLQSEGFILMSHGWQQRFIFIFLGLNEDTN